MDVPGLCVPAPLGVTLPDSAGRNNPGRLTISAARTNVALLIRRAVRPSKIIVRTQSVSAFPPGRVSVGAPLLRQCRLKLWHTFGE